MNKQYVKGLRNGIKSLLNEVGLRNDHSHVALLYNGETRDNVFTVQRTETKENENVFLGLLYMAFYGQSNGNAVSKGDNYLLSPTDYIFSIQKQILDITSTHIEFSVI